MAITSYFMDPVTRRQYLGLSTDTKPTSSVELGSLFYQTDDGVEYIWTGAAWVVWEKHTIA